MAALLWILFVMFVWSLFIQNINHQEKLEEIAQAEVTDTGKPIWEARIDIAGCAAVFEYYGGLAPTIHGIIYFDFFLLLLFYLCLWEGNNQW